MPLYHLSKVTFGYTSTPVVRGISTDVFESEFIAVVGPNGAGKSTLLKILAGLISGYTGVAEFHGKPILHFKPGELAKRVAFVPQETHMAFPFTVGEIVLMGRLPHRVGGLFDSPRDRESAREAMALTDTASLAAKSFTELSGGERQRVVLACALAQDPEVLLLDEPTVFLDLKHQLQFYDMLERLNEERHLTVISVTHDINLAARYARRMIAIRTGVLVADGSPDEMLTPDNLHDIFEITAAVAKRPDGRGSYIIPTA